MTMHTEAEANERGGIIIGRSLTTSQAMARKIMGKNFFGIEEAIKYFGVQPKKNERLSVIEWTEEELRKVSDTHVLVAVFPLSILEIRRRCVARNFFYSHEDAWYETQAFAREKGETGWALVRKTPVPNSTSKTWQEQQVLLSKEEETPTACVMVYTIIGHYLATGERLFENVYVRCSDVDSDGDRVYVGQFLAYGLYIYYFWDGFDHDYIGVSSARKPDSVALS